MIYGKKNITHKTQINTSRFVQEGETLESKLARLTLNEEDIDLTSVKTIYQERKAGVDPMCDIRTDRMQIAQDACTKITRTHILARANRDDMGKKKQEDFTYLTDTNGNIVKNPSLTQNE